MRGEMIVGWTRTRNRRAGQKTGGRERAGRGRRAPLAAILAAAAVAAGGCTAQGPARVPGDRPGRRGPAGDAARAAPPRTTPDGSVAWVADLETRLSRFAPVDLDFDDSVLDGRQRQVLLRLVEASRVMDEIYLRQVDPRAPDWRRRIGRAVFRGDLPGAVASYFAVMMGPWDRRTHHEPFVGFPGAEGWIPKPKGAGFYPPDLTEKEIRGWIRRHPADEEALLSTTTVVRREADGGLRAEPYARAYADLLGRAAALLREAATFADNESLRRFLELRARAFETNDYFESELAWMDLKDVVVEPTIGPYEVYEDELLGAKASFEAFVTIRDPRESAALARLAARLPELDAALPLDARWKTWTRGAASPISVAQEVAVGGEAHAGIQTLAFNLPNDERVRAAKGSKKVMLKNVVEAKFQKILLPIAGRVVAASQRERVRFEPFFTTILLHEFSHGLGPASAERPDGSRVDVSRALGAHYSAIEEAKADLLGLWDLEQYVAWGEFPREYLEDAWISYLAGCFRAVRFGATEAHAKAVALAFNELWDRGAFVRDDHEGDGSFRVDLDRAAEAVREVAGALLEVQARGDAKAAARWLDRAARIRPEMQALLDRLEDVPVDIRPRFTVAEKAAGW